MGIQCGQGTSVSIHAPRTGRDVTVCVITLPNRVSIHAPRTGRDPALPSLSRLAICFNPRAPHGARPSLFPARPAVSECFNPRAPHGARHGSDVSVSSSTQFQSTRPARGATSRHRSNTSCRCRFNPRAPHGARRDTAQGPRCCIRVSIHAPRTGRDRLCHEPQTPVLEFQSTRPARGATNLSSPTVNATLFQSTRPARGATSYW